MPDARLRPRVGWVPTVAALLAIAVFLRLGWWQVSRAREAMGQRAAYEAQVQAAPVNPGTGPWSVAALKYRRLDLAGRYEPQYQILLDNQFNHGAVGYEVLTPFQLDGSEERVLVNRGWIPLPVTGRAQLPPAPAPAGHLDVIGLAVVPGPYFRLGQPQPVHPWHTRWEYLDLARYRAAVPFAVEPLVVLLQPDQPGGFVRHWARPGAGVSMHEGYALQWFLFALSVLAIYVLLNRPRGFK